MSSAEMLVTDQLPPFSKGEYERRFRMLREAMSKKGLDCVIVYGHGSFGGDDPGFVNAVYLSNVVTVIHNYVVFPLKGDPTLITGSHAGFAKKMSSIDDTRANADLVSVIITRVKELNLEKGKIGIVGPNTAIGVALTLPWEHRERLHKELPGVQFETVTPWYLDLILVKSEEEIKYLERAAKITDVATDAVVDAIRPGTTLADVYETIKGVARTYRVTVPGFNIRIGKTTHPTGMDTEWLPSRTAIKAGDYVCMTPFLSVGGYQAKVLLTVFMGEPPQKFKHLVETGGKAHLRLVNELKPGMTGADAINILEPMLTAGVSSWGPAVIGWSQGATPPRTGELPPLLIETPEDRAHVFKPGLACTLGPNVMPYRKEVIEKVTREKIPTSVANNTLATDRIIQGGSCIFTETGVRRLTKYPSWELIVKE